MIDPTVPERIVLRAQALDDFRPTSAAFVHGLHGGDGRGRVHHVTARHDYPVHLDAETAVFAGDGVHATIALRLAVSIKGSR